MKSARPLFFILGFVGAVIVLGVGLGLTPSIQRWALLRAVGTRPGLQLSVREVAAGFSSVRLRDVEVQKSGLKVTLGRLDADYSLLQLVFGRRLHLTRLTADGLVVDASRLSPGSAPAAAAGAPAIAPGLLGRLQLPVELILDEVGVAGRMLLRGAPGQPPIETELKISGGKFAPGAEGTLLLAAVLRNPAAEARVTVLNAQVSLRAAQTGQKTFSRVALTAVVDAEGKGLSDQNQLKISAGLVKDAGGENYTCSIDTLLHSVAENVLTFSAALPAGVKEYAGQWTLKARAAQLEPFLLGGTLPDFNTRGEGRFVFNPSTRAVTLTGGLETDVSRLEAIEPAWRAIGPVKLQARFDVAVADDIARLHQLEVRLAGEQPVLELTASRAAEFNLKEGRLRVGGSAPGEMLNLNITGLPLAWVRPFMHEVDVSGGMITGRLTISNEQDRLLVRTVTPLHVDDLTVVQRGQLLLAKAALSLEAEARLAAGEIQAEVTRFNLRTPAGDSVTARLGLTLPVAAHPSVALTATFNADLPQLLAPWLPLGRVKAAGETDLIFSGGKIELRRLGANLTDAAGLSLFKADALRPFVLELATRRAATIPAAGGSNDLMHIVLGRIPLDWVPLNQPGAQLGGEVEQGEFMLSAEGDKLAVRSAAPLKLRKISLAQDGRPALTGLDIEARPSLEMTGHAAAGVQTGDVTIRAVTGETLMTLKGEATRAAEAGLRGALTFNLEVPALATQPLFAGARTVTQGRASGEIRAAVGGTRQVEARLTINGLVAREGGQILPVANLSFRAVAQADGKVSVQAPLLLDRSGQRSDLNFALELAPVRGGFGLDGKLTGEHVELTDAVSLLGVFLVSATPGEEPPASAAAPASGKAVADTAPAWARFQGQLALDIKSVTRGADWSMTGLTGLVALEPARITLQKLAAAFGEKGRLAAKAELNFAGGARPYGLTGDFSLTEFDAGKLFKALEPDKPATVEGIFSVTGHLTGSGETLNRTVELARGQFELTSRQGIFRGLQRTSNKVSLVAKAAGLVGSLVGGKTAEKLVGNAIYVDQFAQSVAELNYDQLNVRLVRDESLNMNLSDVSLVTPEIRLLGKGVVTYAADRPLLEQPLSLSLSLAGRGKIEQQLGKLHLLDGTRDELGYAKTSQPVVLGGTLARPDPTAFFVKIAVSNVSKLTDFLTPDN